ncbi:YbaB/EbfC family nucleoid-associated protein [Streptomyces sp. NPDC006990]|uniref:YbaB/EbfC family nucleoid-associated protein n=1 Tax=Streptomyces sp. NPDC006990 TaxID=3154481 RepID=UPI0034532338
MTESMAERIAKARARLDETREAIGRAGEQLQHTSETVRSRDRAVEVTVGPQGELTGLTFPENKFAGMTGPQLAASVLEASDEARRRVAQRVMETFAPFTGPLPHAPEAAGVEIDWEQIFGTALSGGDGPGAGRAGARLRDEIVEDDGDAAPGGRS